MSASCTAAVTSHPSCLLLHCRIPFAAWEAHFPSSLTDFYAPTPHGQVTARRSRMHMQECRLRSQPEGLGNLSAVCTVTIVGPSARHPSCTARHHSLRHCPHVGLLTATALAPTPPEQTGGDKNNFFLCTVAFFIRGSNAG